MRSREVDQMICKETVFDREVFVFKKRPHSILQMLEETTKKFPDHVALVAKGHRETYAELLCRVKNIAANLQAVYHIKKGDRVGLFLNNCPEFIYSVLACATIGAIVVPLNTRIAKKDATFMLDHAQVKLLITEREFAEMVKEVTDERQHVEGIILIDGDSFGWGSFSSLVDNKAQMLPRVEVEETDPLFIMYTSGTTGTPKGAIGSHIGAIHSSLNYQSVLKTDDQTKTLIAVPLFHVTGLIGQFLHMVCVGGTSVLMKRYKTEEYIKTMVEEDITFLFNVPTIYVMMMSHSLFKQYSYPAVQTIAYGGAPMSYNTIYQLRSVFKNVKLHNAYGATETSSPTTIMPGDYSDEKLKSVGLPVPVAELKVVNEAGEACVVEEVGELLIKGPMVVEGYWNNTIENKVNFTEGYWKSGDLAMLDRDGFVYIMDRQKDMINRGGEKIFSAEVENVLYEHPAVLEAAVIGIADQMFGELVKAYIVKENQSVTKEQIVAFLSTKLAAYKVPTEIEFLDKLPRNPGGKIIKQQLKERV